MNQQHRNNSDEESKKRWEFIDRVAATVDDWPDWKKAEISPSKFHNQEQTAKTRETGNAPKLDAPKLDIK